MTSSRGAGGARPARVRVRPIALVAAMIAVFSLVVGCSGGADSLALALGAAWAARRAGTRADILVIDHGLQPGSAEVADGVVARLATAGVAASSRRVEVRPGAGGVEAAARDARLAAPQMRCRRPRQSARHARKMGTT